MAEDILRKNMGKIMFTVIGVLCASIIYLSVPGIGDILPATVEH